MSSSTLCDKCRAKKNEKDEGWTGLSLSGDVRAFGFESLFVDMDLCPKCSRKLLPTIKKFFQIK